MWPAFQFVSHDQPETVLSDTRQELSTSGMNGFLISLIVILTDVYINSNLFGM